MRYAISDLSAIASTQGLDAAASRRLRWLGAVRRYQENRVDVIQLREKTLDMGELFDLARAAMNQLGPDLPATRRPALLVNSRPDLAIAAGADGVHLTSRPGELRPAQVRGLFRAARRKEPTVSVSCHSLEDVRAAARDGADLLLFGPIFEKRVRGEIVVAGVGLEALHQACTVAGRVPVLALGGVTAETTAACLAAGAAGVAGIRLFA